MNNMQFIQALAKEVGKTQATTRDLVKTVIETMRDNFRQGETVRISNFGIFEVKKRKARTIVNPVTKQDINVPEKSKLRIRPAIALKKKINN